MAWFRRPKAVPPTALTVPNVYTPAPLRQPRRGPAIVTAETMMGIPAFYSAISTVAGVIAALPVKDRDGNVIDTTPDADGFFNRPTTVDTWFSFIDSIMWNACIHGNAFAAWIEVDMMGDPQRCELIHPSYITPRQSYQRTYMPSYWIDGQAYTPMDLMHFRAATQGGYLWGISPLKHLATAIAVQASELAFVRSGYEDGAKMTGFLSVPKAMDQTVAQQAADNLAEQIAGRGQGLPVATHGMTWQNVSLTHAELELLAARQWSSTEAAMIIGLPPHLIGAATFDADTYSSVQQDLQLMARLRLNRWRMMVSGQLALHGFAVSLAEDSLLAPSDLEIMQTIKIGIETGTLTANEGREWLGLPPLDDPPELPPTDGNTVTVPDDISSLMPEGVEDTA